MTRIVELALRYVLDSNPRSCEVALDCVDALIEKGENPLRYCPTPMQIVADYCGVRSAKSIAFFNVLRKFFDDNRLLNDTTIMCALIRGLDVRELKNWADIMDLEELTEKYDIFALDGEEMEKK